MNVAVGKGRAVGVELGEGSVGTREGVLVGVGEGVRVGGEVEVRVLVGGGWKGVFEGEGVVLMVGVRDTVGVREVVPVGVIVGVRLGVVEPIGVRGVKVKREVRVAKMTGVIDDVAVGVRETPPPLPGARSAATAPAK